jgi:homocysteine S-methyltransferase
MDAAALHERTRTPLIADGGMGTSLIDTGVALDACMEALNERDPARVTSIHAAFVAAGSQLVLTNTFGANRSRLERHGLADRVAAICAAGVERARAAMPELVGGSIGPLGVRLQPYGRVDPAEAFDAYREQAAALAEAGADVLVIETQTDLRELEQAVNAARDAAPGLALLASATFTRDDRTLLGDTPEVIARRLLDLRVDALGVNCGEGPAQMLRLIRTIAPLAAETPIIARPNAGGPTEVGGRFLYPATPEYVGEITRALLDEGAAIVGGCCGTGPAHTRAIADAVRDRGPRARVELPAPSVAADPAPPHGHPPDEVAGRDRGRRPRRHRRDGAAPFVQRRAARRGGCDAPRCGRDGDRRRRLAHGEDADERLGSVPARA